MLTPKYCTKTIIEKGRPIRVTIRTTILQDDEKRGIVRTENLITDSQSTGKFYDYTFAIRIRQDYFGKNLFYDVEAFFKKEVDFEKLGEKLQKLRLKSMTEPLKEAYQDALKKQDNFPKFFIYRIKNASYQKDIYEVIIKIFFKLNSSAKKEAMYCDEDEEGNSSYAITVREETYRDNQLKISLYMGSHFSLSSLKSLKSEDEKIYAFVKEAYTKYQKNNLTYQYFIRIMNLPDTPKALNLFQKFEKIAKRGDINSMQDFIHLYEMEEKEAWKMAFLLK